MKRMFERIKTFFESIKKPSNSVITTPLDGKLIEGKFHGKIRNDFPDGEYFIGNVQADEVTFGTLYYSSGQPKYRGEFSNGLPNGQGTAWVDGSSTPYGGWRVVEGDFIDGILVYGNTKIGGHTFEGEWKITDSGSLPYRGTIDYQGGDRFVGDIIDWGPKKGTWFFAELDFPIEKYEGIFNYEIDNMFDNIKGKITFRDGSEYSGEIHDLLPHGNGVWTHGQEIFEGEFINGVLQDDESPNFLLDEEKIIIEKYNKLMKKDSNLTLLHLLNSDESTNLEFKASLWTSYNGSTGHFIENQNKKNLSLEDSVVKTIAGFLNTNSGTLLIGVKDKERTQESIQAEITGIEADYRWLKKGKQDSEGFEHSLRELLRNSFSNPSYEQIYVSITFPTYDGYTICRVDVEKIPSGDENNALYCKTKTMGNDCFFVRSGDSTISHTMQNAHKYIKHHFGNTI